MLARAPAEAVRLLLLRAQYRAPLEFTDAGLAEAQGELDRFYRALAAHPSAAEAPSPAACMDALCDDLNTPAALAAMHALADRGAGGRRAAAAGLRGGGALLGLLQADPAAWFQRRHDAERSRPPSPSAWPPARPATSPAPTPSAPNCWPTASCSRTPPAAPPGRACR